MESQVAVQREEVHSVAPSGRAQPFFSSSQRRVILLSPFLVIAIGHVTARISFHFLGAWAWVLLCVVYWCAMYGVVFFTGGFTSVIAAYRRTSRWPWWMLAVVVGLIPCPILLRNLSLLRMIPIAVCWFVLALANPFLEESYWRGLLGEATSDWPAWIAGLYSTLLFTAGHPLQWGIFSTGLRSPYMCGALIVMGVVWSTTYRRTRSLRAVTFSHTLVDLGNMSIWVFLNLLSVH